MTEDVVKHDEIFEEGYLAPAKKEADELTASMRLLESALKDVIKVSGGKIQVIQPKDVQSIQQLHEETAKLIAADKGLTEVQKQLKQREDELVKGKLKLAEANRQQNLILKNQIILENQQAGTVQRLRAELALVTNAWIKTKDAEQLDINVTGSLAQQKLILTNQLKKLEGATGDNRREVGNYKNALGGLTKGLGGLTGLLVVAANALGINTNAVVSLRDASRELITASRDLSHVGHLQTLASSENTVATEANTIATETNTETTKGASLAQRIYAGAITFTTNAFKALATAQGLATLGLSLIVGALAAFAYKQYQATKALGDYNTVLDKGIEKNRDAKYALEQLNAQQEINNAAAIEASQLQEKLLETEGASTKAIYDQKQKTFNAEKKQLEDRRQFVSDDIDLQKKYLEQLTSQAKIILEKSGVTGKDFEEKRDKLLYTETGDEHDAFVKVIGLIDETGASINDLGNEYSKLGNQIKDFTKKQQILDVQLLESARKNASDFIDIQAEKAKLHKQSLFNNSLQTIEDEKNLNDQLFDIDEKLLEDKMKLYKDEAQAISNITGINKDLLLKQNKDYQNLSNALRKLRIEHNKKTQEIINKGIIDNAAENKRIQKEEYDAAVEGGEAVFEQQRYDANVTIKNKKKLNHELLEIDLAQARYNLEEAKKHGQDTIALQKAVDDALLALLHESEQKHLKVLEERANLFTKIYEGIFNGLENRSKRIKELNDQRISDLNDQIKTQQDLFARGEKNVLDFVTREHAKALEERAKQDKADRRRQQAKQLAETFLEFYKDYAKDGDLGAAAKALRATLLGKAIADSLSGNAFAEGVENLQGPGTTTSDSIHARLSKGESVITAIGTAETPGLATAVNEKGKKGAQEWILKNAFMPNMPQENRREIVEQAQNTMLMKELIKVVKDKREFQLGINGDSEVVTVEKLAGIVQEIIHKRSTVTRPRRND